MGVQTLLPICGVNDDNELLDGRLRTTRAVCKQTAQLPEFFLGSSSFLASNLLDNSHQAVPQEEDAPVVAAQEVAAQEVAVQEAVCLHENILATQLTTYSVPCGRLSPTTN